MKVKTNTHTLELQNVGFDHHYHRYYSQLYVNKNMLAVKWQPFRKYHIYLGNIILFSWSH